MCRQSFALNVLIVSLDSQSIHAWIRKNNIKTEQGVPLDFKDHLFLFDIYNDFSPKQVILKAAQVGFSTMAIMKSLWLAKNRGMDIIYTLPTANDCNDFVSGKVNRMVNNNPVLQQYVKDKDSVEQKRVGDSVIYYRGTWTEKAALMVSSDLNIHDEEDRSKGETIQQYSSRLQHSNYKWSWHFSNPSVQANGVARYWEQSTQSHWFIKCGHCGKAQFLSWPDSFDFGTRDYCCKHCRKAITPDDRRAGQWVKKRLNAEYQGYWISLMMAPRTTAEEILRYYETKSKEYFYNFVLGLPYVGEGNTVTPDLIYRNLTHTINSQERVVIGCDSGLIKHFVVGNKEGIFYYGKTETWEDIEGLLRRFPRSIAVIDALPDLTEPRKLREKYPGRIFLCHYGRDRKTLQFIRWGTGKEWGNVIADRNRIIQMVIDEYADMRIPLQGTQDDWSDYYSHWATMYRMMKPDVLGTPQIIWESNNGLDHWVHATSYWRIGMNRMGTEEGSLLSMAPTTLDVTPSAPVQGETIFYVPAEELFNFDV
jgi:hypothetical protein